MLETLKTLTAHQTVRFLILGGTAAAINWLVRFPLSAVLPLDAAIFVAYVIGMSAGFPLYRAYVFPGSDRPLLQQTLMFLVVNLIGAVVVLGLTLVFVFLQAGASYPDFVRDGLAHGLAIGIGAVVNFFGHKLLTFSTSQLSAPLGARN
jgi:putative flippase GtrA